MEDLKTLLIKELQDLRSAEQQLITALPNMAAAAHNPKLQEAFNKHLEQTSQQNERLQQACEMLGAGSEEGETCRAMEGLIEEGEKVISEAGELDERVADLALIGAAQKVEHYEIAAYGTARTLAAQIGERGVYSLLSQTLGEESRADHILTVIAKPILQEASAGIPETGTAKSGRSKSPRVRHA